MESHNLVCSLALQYSSDVQMTITTYAVLLFSLSERGIGSFSAVVIFFLGIGFVLA